MKRMGLGIMLTMVVLLGGCGLAKPKVPENAPIATGIAKEDMRVYIDNSADVDKQRRAVEGYVWAFNNTEEFKVVNTPGFLQQRKWNTVEYVPRENGDIPYYFAKRASINKFFPYRKINTEIFYFEENIDLGGGLFGFSSDKLYPKKKYQAKKLGDISFEIIGFDSPKEAFDIYLQLLRDCVDLVGNLNEDTFLTKLKEIGEKSDTGYDWNPRIYYTHIPLRIDPKLLSEENRLVIYPIILDTTIKLSFVEMFKDLGIKTTTNPKKANLTMLVQNIFYESKNSTSGALQDLRSRFARNKTLLSKELEASRNMNHIFGGKAFLDNGHQGIGLAMTALGAIGMIADSSNKNMTIMHHVTLATKEGIIHSSFLSPKKLTIKHEFAYTPYLPKILNDDLAENFAKKIQF